MDLKAVNYTDDSKFEEMLNKIHTMQLNSTLLESPSATNLGILSLTSSSYTSSYLHPTKYNKGVIKKICLDNPDIHKDNIVEEIDLNKTYSSRTMNQKQLSLMLDALEDDEKI